MLVAVTGANGFLGSHTVAALHRSGHRVRALVRRIDRADAIYPFVHDWCTGDVADAEVAASLVAQADAVIHIAMDWAALHNGPVRNAERNLLSALRLLDLARVAGVPQFLYVSSMDVYHDAPDDRPRDENDPVWPRTLYGATKAAVELHIRASHAAHGINASAWRPATMYGINRVLARSHWFELVSAIKRGQAVEARGVEDLVWVEDVADAVTLALDDRSVAGEVYNLVDAHVDLQLVAQLATALSASATPPASSPPSPGRFLRDKAIAFFNRHGNSIALRRAHDQIRHYIAQLMQVA